MRMCVQSPLLQRGFVKTLFIGALRSHYAKPPKRPREDHSTKGALQIPSLYGLWRLCIGASQSPSTEAPRICTEKDLNMRMCVQSPSLQGLRTHIHIHIRTFHSFLLLTLSCFQDISDNNKGFGRKDLVRTKKTFQWTQQQLIYILKNLQKCTSYINIHLNCT